MSSLVSLIGWTFLPNLVTNWVQAIYYGVAIRAGDPKPQPGSPRYAEHRRRIHILVVSAYLLYTIYEADYEIRRAGSFYSDLSLTPAATEREVKSRFRRLAALYHPDKMAAAAPPNGGVPQDDPSAAAFFMRLKLASETLTDPARRFAYDRFGPDVVAWHRCVTVRDYVSQGLQGLVPFYGAAGAFMYVLGYFGYLDYGQAWRWITFLSVMLFEAHVVTRPHHPAVLDRVINPLIARLSPFLGGSRAVAGAAAAAGAGGRRAAAAASTASAPFAYLPFQAVQLARKLSVTVYVAMSQIGPMLGADTSTGRLVMDDNDDDAGSAKHQAQLEQAVERLENAAAGVGEDAAALLAMELSPFLGDKEALDGMQGKVKDWLVQNTVRSDPMVRDALGKSLRRRRAEAPFGAKGTK